MILTEEEKLARKQGKKIGWEVRWTKKITKAFRPERDVFVAQRVDTYQKALNIKSDLEKMADAFNVEIKKLF